MMACLVNPNVRKDRKTIAFARYIMAVHLGRELTAEETVDHINEDKTDDSITNLQLMSRKDNKAKSQKPRTWITAVCPHCHSQFKYMKGQRKNSRNPACSRRCASKFQWSNKPL